MEFALRMCVVIWCIWLIVCESPTDIPPGHLTDYVWDENTSVTAEPSTVCSLPVLPHVKPQTNQNYTAGERAEITCETEFRFPHIKSPVLHIVCDADGTWKDYLGDQISSCERVGGCPTPVIPNGHVSMERENGYMPEDLVHIKCDGDYGLPTWQSAFLRCQSDGTWTTSNGGIQGIPTCQKGYRVTECPAPQRIANGQYNVLDAHPYDKKFAEGAQILYYCNHGYVVDEETSMVQSCHNGQWTGRTPKCIKQPIFNCLPPRAIENSMQTIVSGSETVPSNGVSYYPEGAKVMYVCKGAHSVRGVITLECHGGRWIGEYPTCLKGCDSPQSVLNGNYSVHKQDEALPGQRYAEGTEAYYYCHNGYHMQDNNVSVLTCTDGAWHGHVSTCIRRTHCSSPQDIPNGNWILSNFRPDFKIGSKIKYECDPYFKPIGTTELQCQNHGYWSEYPPRCLPTNQYCSEPGLIANGFYMCKPSHCNLFKIGTEVHYVCNKGYEPGNDDSLVQMCQTGGNWSGFRPICHAALSTYQQSGSSVGFNTSTLTIVIATSCGVLGLLVVVMVIVALQRRHKPRSSRLCHSGQPSPPPYPQPNPAVPSEHDRVALIAFADGVQVVLPSYEEAVRGRPAPRLSRFNSDSSHGSSRSGRTEYRPLPSLPPNMRGTQLREPAPGDHHRDHHRNSIITTASVTTRDNVSLMMGSMDTVNISDGTSTSVTVDTYDSAASNPSIATSARATAGSIESSSTNGSLATDDAPLLDHHSVGYTDTMRSHNSDTGTMRSIGSRSLSADIGCDTLRSQGGHSQGGYSQTEAPPIVEVPEESKID